MKMKNILIKGTFIAPSFRNLFLFSAIQTISAPFHSDSASNHRPPSVFDKITKLDDALQVFDQMSQRQPLPSVVKFTQLLQAVTKMQHYSCSIHLFKQMVAIRAPVDLYTFNIVINTKLDDALQLFDQMTQRQPLPSVVKFNQLLTAVAKMKHYSCSIHLFKQMTAIGVPVDVFTTTIVIKCFCQMSCTREEDRVFEAERLFKKLIKERLCEPDVSTYTTMIKGLCKFGINDTAIALLRLMDERGCKLDVMTYSTIIDSLCKNKMVDDALKLFNEMILNKGILPNVVTYSSLIRG
ncbi:hypothetical protein OSB04_011382 [Centaurea solstitialis]|uniref:Pentatricopeptide repeat-containing protein n=1 Tax=Centaurea solstitialis TaxID=347529 RepID=A0AA38T9B3_9ASTR|nr:hypothetical protein OSB04_011382 [Centaurea solstitialis]